MGTEGNRGELDKIRKIVVCIGKKIGKKIKFFKIYWKYIFFKFLSLKHCVPLLVWGGGEKINFEKLGFELKKKLKKKNWKKKFEKKMEKKKLKK